MKLFHSTTAKKVQRYRHSGFIKPPVRVSTTLNAAMAWSMKVGRTAILEIECDAAHKLPDHHNCFGEAWWNDSNVTEWKCVFSADNDA